MRRKTTVSPDQFGFNFDELLCEVTQPSGATEVAEVPKRTESFLVMETGKRAELPVALPSPAVQVISPDLERMAEALAAHPDFRVVRRLVPCHSFADAAPASDQPDDALATLLVLDTETTGLNPARDKMVELAMLRVQVNRRTGQPVGALQVYNGLEDPGMPMPEEARAVTGITDEMLRGQRLDDVQVHAMLAGTDLVIAHNAGFDRPFVEARFPAFEGLKWACSFADIDWKSLGRGSAKLSALGMDLGFFYDAHRAEMDCHALLAVLMAPLAPLASLAAVTSLGSPASSAAAAVPNGLLHLLTAAASPSFRVQATAAPFESKDLLKARGYRWDAHAKAWHTRLKSAEAFAAECDWLKQAVYGGRSARIEVEARDALSNYALRPGRVSSHAL